MAILKDILSHVQVKSILGTSNLPVTSICIDSRKAAPGSAFIAIKGTLVDGHQYIRTAISQGANTVSYTHLDVYKRQCLVCFI